VKAVLLDTNVILDFALDRTPFDEQTSSIIKSIEEGKLQAFVTASSITDIFYIASRSVGKQQAKDFLTSLFSFVEILEIGKEIIIRSLNSEFEDFEDAVQNFSAIENDINIIITRNKKDFNQSSLTILTPDEFLSTLH
jgi:predicted nucleic acid-binding protein